MRLNECETVKEVLQKQLGINLTVVDASEEFLAGLKGEHDPEKKRKFIGGKFIDVFEAEARKIEAQSAGKVEWFLQGTLYPGKIISADAVGSPKYHAAFMYPHILFCMWRYKMRPNTSEIPL
jgi:GMP synthase (glutamine-hydrolysing)